MIKTIAVSDDRNAMAAAVSRYNIKHFCKRLAEETDRTKRQTIFNLIAEEKARLDALTDLADMGADRLKRVMAE